jgi:hypothetical protein
MGGALDRRTLESRRRPPARWLRGLEVRNELLDEFANQGRVVATPSMSLVLFFVVQWRSFSC